MTNTDIDLELSRLDESAVRIGAGLVDLELDPYRRLIEDSSLVGESARVWAESRRSIAQLWQRHDLLHTHLDRVRTMRGKRQKPSADRAEEIAELLIGRSLEDTSGSSVVRCTPAELLAVMTTGYEEVTAIVKRFTRVLETLPAKLEAAETLAAETVDLARKLGEAETPEVALARHQASSLRHTLTVDPLSVDSEACDGLESALRTVLSELLELDAFRREIDVRLAAALALRDRFEQAQTECAAARRLTLSRIVAPDVFAPPHEDLSLASQLEQVQELVHAGAWRPAHDALRDWEHRASNLLAQATDATARNRAPIERRNQLRGRLEAFRAKADQLGLSEDPLLSPLCGRAHEALFTAPTDLDRAEELLTRYQRGLLGRVSHRVVEEVRS